MLPHYRCWLVAGIFAVTIGGTTIAQEEMPADGNSGGAGSTYSDLRQSTVRTTQLLADRYHNLVRLQDWSDLTGKFKTSARYVEHDPDLKWVKLAAVKGSGKTRVVKEVTVPVAKLSKTCQSRVRQIALLQTKLDELAAAEPDSGEAGGVPMDDRGAPMTDEQGVEPREVGQVAEAMAAAVERAPREAARIDDAVSPATGQTDPDPLGFAEIAPGPPPAAVPVNVVLPAIAPPDPGAPPAAGQPPGNADRTNWELSYDAFRANFTVTPEEGGQSKIDWGELQALRTMGEADGRGERPVRLGDVWWNAPFQGIVPLGPDTHAVNFDLPALPEPVKIEFRLDIEGGRSTPEHWATIKPGDRIRYKGRLAMAGPTSIIVYVREPELVQAAPPRRR